MRIITSFECQERIDKIFSVFPFKNKAQILRIALSVSLKNDNYFLSDSLDIKRDGFEINSETLFGKDHDIYRLVFTLKYKLDHYNNDLFYEILYYHIESGIKKLYNEMRFVKKNIDFLKYITEGNS